MMKRLWRLAAVVAAVAGCGPGKTPSPADAGPLVQCSVPTGGPTTHAANINADETWTAATGPHVVANDFTIYGVVTLEPCVEVQLAAGVTVTVGLKGAIRAAGTADRPIAIDAEDPAKPWATIRSIGGEVTLAYTTVSGGGQPASNGTAYTQGALYGQAGSDPTAAAAAFSLTHVTIQGSLSDGVTLNGIGFDPASDQLTISGSAQYPVRLGPQALGTLPAGSYTGNAHDEILVAGGVGAGIQVGTSTAIHARGVPYHVGDATELAELRVGDGPGTPVATLTIDPGVTLRFETGGVLAVEHFSSDTPASGALVARGTAAAPIVFTSAAAVPAAGDWVGLFFSSDPDPSDALDHVTIAYAGGDSSTIGGCPLNTSARAALLVGYLPAGGFLTNSIISDSARDGTFRGWIGSDIDFNSTNTFTNVPGCHETNVLTAQGVCPTSPCPQ